MLFRSSGDFPNLGIEPLSLMSPALAGRFFTTSITWEAPMQRKVKVAQLCPTLCDPMDWEFSRPHGLGILQARIFGVGSLSLLQRIKPRSPVLQVDSLPAGPQGKPKNTGVGSLSLLQRIFLAQELNWGLPNCRQFLYQLSYEASLPCSVRMTYLI